MLRPILIIDFEATCWSPDDAAPEPLPECVYAGEIIEFGCVVLDARGQSVARTWQQYVHPLTHPRLTAFCTELTGIGQAQVDSAPFFPEALAAFRDALQIRGDDEPWFCSWGNYDRNILVDECQKHHVEYPFRTHNHINLKAEAKRVLGLKKRMGVSRALEAIGLDFEGRPHSGADDACNTGRIAIEMVRRGWKPPAPE